MVANKLRGLSAAQRGSDGWPLAGVPILIFIINVVAGGWRVLFYKPALVITLSTPYTTPTQGIQTLLS